jgi:D-glycero-D-manno-heptose 1,7-bisphosphate phosphatase
VSQGAVFLDRDGVINEGVPDPATGLVESPLAVAEVRLLPGVPAALRRLARAGWPLACVTNQPAAAKGRVSVAELGAVHERVLELLAREGVVLDTSRICWHHPEGVVAELAGPCGCRKPAPGMLRSAAAELGVEMAASWMIGDTDADVLAGRAAGARTVLIEYPGSAHKRTAQAQPAFRAGDLASAVNTVLGWSATTNRSSARGTASA